MKRPALLLVEDNAELANILADLVESSGRRVRVARRGQEALDALSHESMALVILDFDLPDMNASELLDKLRNNGRWVPPVVLVSARHRRSDECQASEIVERLDKPFDLSDFAALLDRHVPLGGS